MARPFSVIYFVAGVEAAVDQKLEPEMDHAGVPVPTGRCVAYLTAKTVDFALRLVCRRGYQRSKCNRDGWGVGYRCGDRSAIG